MDHSQCRRASLALLFRRVLTMNVEIIVVWNGYAVIERGTSNVLFRAPLRIHAEEWCDRNNCVLPLNYGD